MEKWDNKFQRILHDYDCTPMVLAALLRRYKEIMAFQDMFKEVNKALGGETTTPDIVELQREMAVTLLSKGLIDPAFAFATSQANFLPMCVHPVHVILF
jgi:hypothetical protein